MLVVTSWLQEYLDKPLKPEQMATAMELAGIEVEGLSKSGKNSIIDISTAPNRVDLQSYIGLAREVAAHTNAKAAPAPKPSTAKSQPITLFENRIKKLAPRYYMAKIKLKKAIGPSPVWLQKRLSLSGTRPINIVVDVTNYVMLAYGQPLHAFDADKVQGKLVLRQAKAGEQLKTLDGATRKLEPSDMVIADDSGVIDLLGIMGGMSSEIGPDTRTVLLTTPTLDGIKVRKTSSRLGLRSEASSRFERSLPHDFNSVGSMAATKMLDELVGITIERIEDELNVPKSLPVPIKVTSAHISQLAGITITPQQVVTSLRKLQIKAELAHVLINVLPPYWRPDLKLEEDIFEEVIKIIGLDKVPATLPSYNLTTAQADTTWPKLWQLRDLIAGLGSFEVVNYPFVAGSQLASLGFEDGSHLKLKNPRSPDQSHMRLALLNGLLNTLSTNRLYKDSFSIFEIGRIFAPKAEQLPDEQLHIGVMIKDSKQPYQLAKNILDNVLDLMHLDLKVEPAKVSGALHPAEQAKLFLGSEHIGMIGGLHPALLAQLKIKGAAYWEVALEPLLEAWQTPTAGRISKFETVKRDLTLLVSASVGWQNLRIALSKLDDIKVTYGGEYYNPKLPEQRALTLHLEIGSMNGNLTEAEADKRQAAVLAMLKKDFGAKPQV